MEPRSSILFPQRRGCNALVTIIPRMVVRNQDQVITDSSTKLTSDDQVIMMSEGYPSDQETGSKSRLKKLAMIKKELQKKLGYNHAEKKKSVIDQPQMSLNRVYSIYSKLLHEKALFKWIIIVLNVIIELCQAILSQDLAEGVINKSHYGKLSLISASICLITSILDIVFEAIEGGVRWRRRGLFPWFYYPGKRGPRFGTFWLGFGLVSSTIQFGFNLVGYVTKGGGGSYPVRFRSFVAFGLFLVWGFWSW